MRLILLALLMAGYVARAEEFDPEAFENRIKNECRPMSETENAQLNQELRSKQHERWKTAFAGIDRIIVKTPAPEWEGKPTSTTETDPETIREFLSGIKPAAERTLWYKSRLDGAVYSELKLEAIHQCGGDFHFVLMKGDEVIAKFVIAHGNLESAKLGGAPLEEKSLRMIYAFANWHLPFYRVDFPISAAGQNLE